jgi:hypothetical protein
LTRILDGFGERTSILPKKSTQMANSNRRILARKKNGITRTEVRVNSLRTFSSGLEWWAEIFFVSGTY